MRDLVTTHFVSLDGVAEAPGGEPGYRHSGWTMDIEPDPAQYERKGREQEEAAAFVMGGRSYEAFSEVWPPWTTSRAGTRCPSTSSRAP
ncbi:hypothetical protein [Nocardioides sp.]|uniref:hypothetical protein n=1 Tax=Nocardioides sp. TaxID=35761 RepID=UPI00378374E1